MVGKNIRISIRNRLGGISSYDGLRVSTATWKNVREKFFFMFGEDFGD